MIKVKNKKIMKHISIKHLIANKIRNGFIILAIILTTFTLTSVFSMGISYYESVKQQSIMMQGSKYDAQLLSPTSTQIDLAQSMDNIKHIGLYSKAGSIKKYQNEETRLPMVWIDDTNWNHQVKPALEKIVGHYPQKDNELMLSEVSLKKLGIKKAYVGMKLPFHYQNEKGLHEKTFILTGYYKDYITSPKVYVSKALYNQSGYQLEDVNTGQMHISFKNPLLSEDDMNQLRADLHLSKRQELYIDPEVIKTFYGVVFGIGGLSLLIMISGYLLIYNVLSISISKDIQFYGLLNSIGTTSNQIKRLVKRQIALLSLIGIPIGLTLGAFISLVVVPSLLGAFSVQTLKVPIVSFHPIIFIGAALFAFVAVLLGTNKPAKMASNVTSIEAMKYNGISNIKKRKTSTNGHKLARMAWQNIFRYRKRAIIVFLSLFIALTTFITVNSMANSQGVRNILSSFISYDISLDNETFMNEDERKIKQLFNDDFIEQLTLINGIKEVHKVTLNKLVMPYSEELLGEYLEEFFNKHMREPYNEAIVTRFKEHPEDFYGFAVGIDEAYFDKINKTLEKPINKADFLAGKVGIMEQVPLLDFDWNKFVGKELNYELPNGNMTGYQSMKIGGYTTESMIYSGGISPNMYVSDRLLNQFISDPLVVRTDIFFNKSYDRLLNTQVKKLVKDNKEIGVRSKLDQADTMQQSENKMMILGGGLSIILAVIGILNYINMMTSGIQSRRKELATLECVGMTQKQIKKMLTLEGLGYGVITLLLVSTLGLSINYFIFQSANTMKVDFIFPIIPVFIMYVSLLAVCVSIPTLVYRFIQKDSIIERLK